jgi:hypothetical protein
MRFAMRSLLLIPALLLTLVPLGTASADWEPYFETEHFRCYTVDGQAPSADSHFNRVTLSDQFEQVQRTKVLKPILVCNPVQKCRLSNPCAVSTSGNGCEDVYNPFDHLVCYRTSEPPEGFVGNAIGKIVEIDNQFEINERLGIVKRSNLLCVPSEKCELVNGAPQCVGL